jgi:hypothetical protein
MKSLRFLVLVLTLLFSLSAFAGTVHVKGYTKKDGTYVAPHDRTAPDSSKANNWSTKGNVNPETGKKGTVDPNKAPAKK